MKLITLIPATLLLAPLAALSAPPDAPKFEIPIGSPAPQFTLRTLDGTLTKLEDFAYPGNERARAKKRPLVLDFFRTDCAPCQASMPELVQAWHDYNKRGLEVVLVALLEPDQGREKLQKYLERMKLPFLVLVDDNEYFSKKYLGPTGALPATFLIDRDGVIRRSRYGVKGAFKDTFASLIEQLLPTKQP
jgi:peroxiredoxin